MTSGADLILGGLSNGRSTEWLATLPRARAFQYHRVTTIFISFPYASISPYYNLGGVANDTSVDKIMIMMLYAKLSIFLDKHGGPIAQPARGPCRHILDLSILEEVTSQSLGAFNAENSSC